MKLILVLGCWLFILVDMISRSKEKYTPLTKEAHSEESRSRHL